MKHFLSIDWDFFPHVTPEQRELMFPQGDSELLSPEEKQNLWYSLYKKYPEIRKLVTVKKDYVDKVKTILDHNPTIPIYMSESHEHLYGLLKKNTRFAETFHITNLDFHHDLYTLRYSGKPVNCSNWAFTILEERPYAKYTWVRRTHSERKSMWLKKPDIVTGIHKLPSDFEVSHIFICRSDVWSPPHLDPYLYLLIEGREVIYLVPIVKTPRESFDE